VASAAESDATWSGRRPAAAAAFLGGGDVGDAVGFFGYLFLCGSLGRDESESAAASAFVFVTLGWGDESDRRRVHGGWAQLQRSWSALISGILVVSFHHVFFC